MSLRPLLTATFLVGLLHPVAALPDSASQDGRPPVGELAGLWQATREFGPEASGTLDLHLEGTGGRAEIAGFSAPVTVDDEIRFEIVGDRGRFRAPYEPQVITAEGEIVGHWIQPPTAANFVRFATPVVLKSVRPGHWRGEVRPLRDRMTFFLSLSVQPDGSTAGFLRNPEANFGRHFHIERVVRDGDRIQLLEPGHSDLRLAGPFDSATGILSLFIPDAGGTFDFHKLGTGSASTFEPRPGLGERYAYRPPAPAGNGWPTGSLTEVGIDVGTIERLIQTIVDTPAESIESPYTHAILLARHGKLVLEEYFHGFTADQPHDTRSASKTVTSTLVGLAAHAGAPVDPEILVYAAMNGGEPPSGLDPRKSRMRLRHLLTMTPGLACDDNDDDSPGAEWVMQSQPSGWVRYTLDLPMVAEPGEHLAYCSASTNLAGAVLSAAAGSWLPELLQRYFAAPLGIERYHMNLMPGGDGYGGGGLHLTARDFLKLAQLLLDEGRWRGRRLLAERWVRDAKEPVGRMFDQGYGYAWWVIEFPYRDRTVEAYYAGGNGGQYAMAIPELDLALVLFGGNYGQRATHYAKQVYIPDYILPAVLDRPPGDRREPVPPGGG